MDKAKSVQFSKNWWPVIQWQKRQGRHWRHIFISHSHKDTRIQKHEAKCDCAHLSSSELQLLLQNSGYWVYANTRAGTRTSGGFASLTRKSNSGIRDIFSTCPSLSHHRMWCARVRCQLIPNFSQYLSLHRRTLPSKCQNKPTNSQFRVVEIICEDLKTQYIFPPCPTLLAWLKYYNSPNRIGH